MDRCRTIVPPEVIPEWFAILNDNARINVKDFAKLLGCCRTTIYDNPDLLPPSSRLQSNHPNKVWLRSRNQKVINEHGGVLSWRVGDVRKWLKELRRDLCGQK